jgi:low affinity Fe/Cu permease
MGDPTNPVSKLESRWIAFITAIALFFGGRWLQNQYTTTLRVQEELAEFMRFADDRYVEKDYLKTVTDRLERIEEKIDALKDDQARERGQASGVNRRGSQNR